MDNRWYHTHTIKNDEIAANGKVSPFALIQIMQEASLQSALNLKVSFWDMESSNASWVLIKKKIHYIAYPNIGDAITVLTYPAGFDRIFAYRDYKIYNDQKELIAYASSTWTLINLNTRKLEKLPADILAIQTPEEDLLERVNEKIPKVSNSEFENIFKVKWFDIDWNKHANNSYLIKCILEGTPTPILENQTLDTLILQFKKESLLNDSLISSFQSLDAYKHVHDIKRESDQATIITAQSQWRDQI